MPCDDTSRTLAALAGCAGLLAAAGIWHAWPPSHGTLAGALPTDQETLRAVVELLRSASPLGGESGAELLFVDLGCGDGRVVGAVARGCWCRAVGVDVLPESVALARAAQAAEAAPGCRCRFLCADMAAVDLSEADVVFLYVPRPMARQFIEAVLPTSGLRHGALLLLEDAPAGLAPEERCGLRHLRRGGVRPPSARNPPLDLFEWRGVESGGCSSSGTPAELSPFFPSAQQGGGRPKTAVWGGAE